MKNSEEEVLKCIKNKDRENPFISFMDIVAHLFLLNRLKNPSEENLQKKLKRTKKEAESSIDNLLSKKRIKRIDKLFGTIYDIDD